jgi:hypothetical protein
MATSLAAVAATLVAASVVLSGVKLSAGDGRWGWIIDLFRLNKEGNLPSFFSGLLLLIATGLLAVIWQVRGIGRGSWLAMAGVFGFLSYDELFALHGRIIDPLRDLGDLPGVFSSAWIPAYAALGLAVGGLFWSLWRQLDNPHRRRFATAAFIYLTGAVGFEMLGGLRYSGSEAAFVHSLLDTAEESLELTGLIVFIHALLSLLAEVDPPVSLSFERST